MDTKQATNEEKALSATSGDTPVVDPAPEGGARAWSVAGGSACIIFCTMGFANSFGTLQAYYLTHQLAAESASKVSWIGSLSLFLQFFAGMLGGPLFDRYGEKAIWPPALLYIFAMMMLSLCQAYWHFMFVQGVLVGISTGLLQFPAIAASAQYFHKRRALALGLVVSGSSIGGVILPIALSKMLNDSTLSFGWSIRVIGFSILPMLVFACMAIKARLPPRKTQFFLFSAYTEPLFLLLIIALFFMFFGFLTPFFYLPTYAMVQGMDETTAGYLPAVINGASTFGRIAMGLSADRYGRLNMAAVGSFSTSIAVFCLSSINSSAGFFIYAVFFGFTSGTVISSGATAFSLCASDPRDIGTYLGMGIALGGIGGLIGPPVNGAIVGAYGSFYQVSLFSGALCLIGGIVMTCAKMATPQGLLGKV